MQHEFDVVLIGGGILGTATAMKLAQAFPELRLALVEKENRLAAHQTGHNSGVIHSGIYYRPGSLKARLCVSGARQLVQFCREHGIRHELCGKVVIATRAEEVEKLRELHRRGTANGVPGLRWLDPAAVRELEPHTTCVQGLHVPSTGIVDFQQVTETYGDLFRACGGTVRLGCRVTGIKREARFLRLETNCGSIATRAIINCGGLYADHLSRMAGQEPPCRIVPFRGEYYRIRPERSFLVKHLIYPVPDPRYPFLGVHFTRMVDGKVEAGPNAVLAFAREGYYKKCVVPRELAETLAYRGFWRLAGRYWRQGIQEMVRSCSKERFTRALQQLIPEIRSEDLIPGGAGVRAQALGKEGTLLDDFVIVRNERMVHVLNAPSPAATSALAIADEILAIASTVLKE